MAPCPAMELQQMFEQAAHIGVRGVDLVDDQRMAHQAGGAKMGMFGLHGAEQRLIDRANRDRPGEEALRPLGGPMRSVARVRPVFRVIRRRRL